MKKSLAGWFFPDGFFGSSQFLLEFGQAAILNLSGEIQIIAALGLFQFDLRLLDLAIDDANGIDGRFFVLPLRFELVSALFEIG